VALVRK